MHDEGSPAAARRLDDRRVEMSVSVVPWTGPAPHAHGDRTTAAAARRRSASAIQGWEHHRRGTVGCRRIPDQ